MNKLLTIQDAFVLLVMPAALSFFIGIASGTEASF